MEASDLLTASLGKSSDESNAKEVMALGFKSINLNLWTSMTASENSKRLKT